MDFSQCPSSPSRESVRMMRWPAELVSKSGRISSRAATPRQPSKAAAVAPDPASPSRNGSRVRIHAAARKIRRFMLMPVLSVRPSLPENGLTVTLVEVDGVPHFSHLQILFPVKESHIAAGFDGSFDRLRHVHGAVCECFVQDSAVEPLRGFDAKNP